MELFFNLLWLALSSLLLGFWILGPSRWTDERLRPSTRAQIVALVLLIVILLPVISLTDDLQACTAPAESEHLARRVDLQAITDGPLQAASILIAALGSFDEPPRLQILSWLSPAEETETPSAGYLRILGNRPPPAV